MNRTRSRRLLFALFVVLALAGVYGVAGLRHPAPASATKGGGRSAGQAAVTSALRACAEPGSAGVTAGSLAVASMPGSASGGSAVATRLVPGGSGNPGQAVATVTQPGVPHVVTVKAAPPLTKNLAAGQPGSTPQVTTTAGRGGLVVDATGAMAQGLEVEQTGPGGLVTAQCGTPGTSFWFAGPGQTSAADIQLYLMNTDGEAADAQVTLYTDVTKSGPLVGDADNSITVPPHSMVEQPLGRLLSSSKVVALNVTTSVGRVVPALRESRTNSDDGGWLQATLAPSTNLVIPGLPSRGGSPELFIAVPGTATAQVKVTAVTSRGSYQPTGGTGIDLLGGTATEIPLPGPQRPAWRDQHFLLGAGRRQHARLRRTGRDAGGNGGERRSRAGTGRHRRYAGRRDGSRAVRARHGGVSPDHRRIGDRSGYRSDGHGGAGEGPLERRVRGQGTSRPP